MADTPTIRIGYVPGKPPKFNLQYHPAQTSALQSITIVRAKMTGTDP